MCIIAVCTISSCRNDAKVSANRAVSDGSYNGPVTGPGREIEEEESRSWYLPGKEQFPPGEHTGKGDTPVGVLYLGFSNEIKVQLFSEFLSVTFREGDFVFRVYKNCRVEFVI